jgi:hypothetical protein
MARSRSLGELGPPRLFQHRISRRAALLTGLSALAVGGSARARGEPVDLLLLLAVDCSYSVSRTEYNLQTQGLALAFLDPEIVKAAIGGPYGRIAVAVMQWSSEQSQILAIPWTLIDGPQAAIRFSASLSTMARQTADGATALGDALSVAGAHIQSAPYEAFRRVIDISGDGRKNTGSVVSPVRDALVANGVTINALVILNEDPNLEEYFSRHVIGGLGHFMIIANDYQEYREAIRRKLIREIRFVPVSDAGDAVMDGAEQVRIR